MRILLPLIAMVCLSSCGTVSDLQSSPAAPAIVSGKMFNKVLVKDFTHTVADDDGTTPVAARKFSDHIATAVRAAKPGVQVDRSGKAGPGTLVIGGEVTRYMEGNAALRFFVGMGAGSSYFDATVRFIDGGDGKEIGALKVDKNSWGLGGGIAATQTVDSFMRAGADKTAKEAAKRLK